MDHRLVEAGLVWALDEEHFTRGVALVRSARALVRVMLRRGGLLVGGHGPRRITVRTIGCGAIRHGPPMGGCRLMPLVRGWGPVAMVGAPWVRGRWSPAGVTLPMLHSLDKQATESQNTKRTTTNGLENKHGSMYEHSTSFTPPFRLQPLRSSRVIPHWCCDEFCCQTGCGIAGLSFLITG